MNKLKQMILLSYISVASVGAAIITPALPRIQNTFNLNHGALEWVVSIFLVGYVLGQLIYGPLANRFGRLNALRAGLSVSLIGIVISIFGAFEYSYILLLLGRLITGLGAAAGLSCTLILIHELFDEKQSKHLLSFSVISFTVGIGLAVSLGGILTEYLSWQSIFWVLLVYNSLMLWGTWLYNETLKEKKTLHLIYLFNAFMTNIKNKRLITFSLVVGLTSIISYAYSAAAPVIAQSLLNLSASEYGYWNLLNILGMLASGFATAFLLKRYEASRIILGAFAGTLLSIGSLIVLALSHDSSSFWFFATTMMLYFFAGMFFPCGSYYAMRAVKDKAIGSSIMSFINMGSATLAVVIMGYLPFSSLSAFIAVLLVAWVLVSFLFGGVIKK